MPAQFPETQWSQLLALRDPGDPRRPELLERLARRYWRPAHDYIVALRPRFSSEAEDLTQQFFTMLLSRSDLERLSPERGSFRAFIKTALKNFVVSAARAARVREAPLLAVQAGEPLNEAPALAPDEAFDRAWTHAVLAEAVERLRDELAAMGRADQFEMFRAYCLEDDAGLTYDELARRHGVGANDVRNRLREARQRLRRIVRSIIREYLAAGEDVEAEVSFILRR